MEDKSPILETEPQEEVEQETETTTQEESRPKDESPEESARIAFEELQKQSEGAGEEDTAEAKDPEPKGASEKPAPSVAPQAKAKEQDIDLDPPERLNAQQRSIYKRCSPAMKKVLHEVVSDLESRTHKAFHQEKAEIVSKQQKYRDLDAVLDPYRKELLARGHSDASAVAELLEIHKGLSNPTTKDKVFEELGAKIGYDWARAGSGGTGDEASLANNPIIKNLMEENKRLREMVEPVHNQIQTQTQQVQQSAIQNMNQQYLEIGQEVDKSGQLSYPKLSQEPEYFERLRPLILSLMQSDPDKSFGDALKMAYNITEKRFGYLQTHQGQIRPSPQKQNNKVFSPPLSVRGKTTSVVDLPAYDNDVKRGETPEESARIAYERLARGVH